MDDIVQALPQGEDASKNEIAVECAESLGEASKRVRELAGERDEDDVLALLLLVNERINASLEAYEQHSGARRVGLLVNVDDGDDDDLEDDDDSQDSMEDWKSSIGKVQVSGGRGSRRVMCCLIRNTFPQGPPPTTTNLLEVPSSSNTDNNSSIAIGLDFLESLSTSKLPPPSQDDAFESWLLGNASAPPM